MSFGGKEGWEGGMEGGEGGREGGRKGLELQVQSVKLTGLSPHTYHNGPGSYFVVSARKEVL